jgi:haloalkane dehalogenase
MLYQYPFTLKNIKVGDHCLSCVDEGRGPAVVMVHGNPSWSYLYRNVISGLHDRYRMIAPDHLGCGLSDKPPDYTYRLASHVDNLESVLDQLQVERCVLMVHDWGGAIGMGWAVRHPERIAGLVVLNSAAFASSRLPLRIAICRWPLLGALLVRGLNGFAGAATVMAVHRPMAEPIRHGFLHPYGSWRDRIAIHRFIEDIPMHSSHPSWKTLHRIETGLYRLREKPMLLLWGGMDFCFTRLFFEEWWRRFPRARGIFCEDAGHYVLEDVLPEALPRIADFVERCYG